MVDVVSSRWIQTYKFAGSFVDLDTRFTNFRKTVGVAGVVLEGVWP